MPETKDQQVRTVVEGLALGVLANGIGSVPGGKLDLEFALAHAWRSWDRADQFPSIGRAVKTDNLLWIGISRSHRTKSFWASWELEQRAYPVLRQEHWTPSDGLELLADERAGEEDWIRLGALFLERFTDDQVERLT